MSIFRTNVFEKIGYYEQGNLAEDMEFGLRMKKKGLKILSCYEAVVYTDVPVTWKNLFIQRTRWYRGSTFNFMHYKGLMFNKKNPDFGFFVMPFLFFTQILTIAVITRMFALFFVDAYTGASVFFQYLAAGGIISLRVSEIILPSSMIFFATAYLLVVFYFFLGFRMIKMYPRIDEIPALAIIILLYPYFTIFVYTQSYLKEILGVKAKWVRVST